MNRPKPYKNRVLSSLPASAMARMAPHLTPATLAQRHTLADGDAPYGYFLEQGMASMVVTLSQGGTVEVGIVGFEGLVGIPILLGTDGAPGWTFMQIAGSGFRIPAARLREEFDRPGPLREYLQKYIQAYLVQTAQTAACNRQHGIEERLARWLLTCRDRTGSELLPLTQEFLGQMLGAPRTTVTLAVGLLERAELISHSRGTVTIRDNAGLQGTACECYGIVRDEFRRLRLL